MKITMVTTCVRVFYLGSQQKVYNQGSTVEGLMSIWEFHFSTQIHSGPEFVPMGLVLGLRTSVNLWVIFFFLTLRGDNVTVQ